MSMKDIMKTLSLLAALHLLNGFAFVVGALGDDNVRVVSTNVNGLSLVAMAPNYTVNNSNAIVLVVLSNGMSASINMGDTMMLQAGVRIKVADSNGIAVAFTESGQYTFGLDWTVGERDGWSARSLDPSEWHTTAIHLPTYVKVTNNGLYNVFVTWDNWLAGGVNTNIHPVITVTNIHLAVASLPLIIDSFSTSAIPASFTNELGSLLSELPQRGAVDRWMWLWTTLEIRHESSSETNFGCFWCMAVNCLSGSRPVFAAVRVDQRQLRRGHGHMEREGFTGEATCP